MHGYSHLGLITSFSQCCVTFTLNVDLLHQILTDSSLLYDLLRSVSVFVLQVHLEDGSPLPMVLLYSLFTFNFLQGPMVQRLRRWIFTE